MVQNELENGETLQHGKYVILSVLGKGGFGITYLSEHSVLKKKVAIKELFLSTQSIFCSRKEDDSRTVRPHFQAQDFEVFKEKFLTEASTLARFTGQKGIVQINDTFPENNTVYFVMDFIDGYSIKEIVHQKGVLSEKEAITYILQILYALKEVHAADILHRDIKPDNLIIRKQDDQIILIDFGIAREFSEDETQTQTAMISVGYAPPEQKLTKAKRSQSMDLYSVGAVLYFCLTSQRPQTSDEILSEEYKSAQTLNSNISDTLNQIIDKSIAKRPKERFQTASEMIEVLENYSISDVGIISDVVGEDTNNSESSFDFNQKPVFEQDDNTIIETQNDFVKEDNNKQKEEQVRTLFDNPFLYSFKFPLILVASCIFVSFITYKGYKLMSNEQSENNLNQADSVASIGEVFIEEINLMNDEKDPKKMIDALSKFAVDSFDLQGKSEQEIRNLISTDKAHFDFFLLMFYEFQYDKKSEKDYEQFKNDNFIAYGYPFAPKNEFIKQVVKYTQDNYDVEGKGYNHLAESLITNTLLFEGITRGYYNQNKEGFKSYEKWKQSKFEKYGNPFEKDESKQSVFYYLLDSRNIQYQEIEILPQAKAA